MSANPEPEPTPPESTGAARQQMRPDEGILVRAPFASITGLDYVNLEESLATPREGFVEDLAAALVAAAQREGKLR